MSTANVTELLCWRLDKHAQSQEGLKFLSFIAFMVYTQKLNQQKSLGYLYWDAEDMEEKGMKLQTWSKNCFSWWNLRLAPFFLKHQFYQMAPKTGKTAYLICVYVQEVCVNSSKINH